MNLTSLIWNLEHKFDVKIQRTNMIENVFPLCHKYIASFVQRWVLYMFSITTT
jgi:acyl carrier protein